MVALRLFITGRMPLNRRGFHLGSDVAPTRLPHPTAGSGGRVGRLESRPAVQQPARPADAGVSARPRPHRRGSLAGSGAPRRVRDRRPGRRREPAGAARHAGQPGREPGRVAGRGASGCRLGHGVLLPAPAGGAGVAPPGLLQFPPRAAAGVSWPGPHLLADPAPRGDRRPERPPDGRGVRHRAAGAPGAGRDRPGRHLRHAAGQDGADRGGGGRGVGGGARGVARRPGRHATGPGRGRLPAAAHRGGPGHRLGWADRGGDRGAGPRGQPVPRWGARVLARIAPSRGAGVDRGCGCRRGPRARWRSPRRARR